MKQASFPEINLIVFEQQLNELWGKQDYLGVIELFNVYQSELEGLDSRMSDNHFAILAMIPFKWYSMYCLDQCGDMEKEIQLVVEANERSPNMLSCMCNSVNYNFSFLLDLYTKYSKVPSRAIAVARCRYADELGDMKAKLEAMAEFDRIGEKIGRENWPEHEKLVFMRRLDEDSYLFNQSDIKSITYQSVPKNNGFLEVVFENNVDSAHLSLPMPNNDSICESGLLSLRLDGKQIDVEINNYQVKEYLVHSPFGLTCHVGDIEISVANLFYHRD